MDLGTVEKKLRNNTYTSHNQFFEDVRKIWSNAFTYNPRNSPVYNMTLEISNYFEELCIQVEMTSNDENRNFLENKVQKLEKEFKDYKLKEHINVNRKGTKTANNVAGANQPQPTPPIATSNTNPHGTITTTASNPKHDS